MNNGRFQARFVDGRRKVSVSFDAWTCNWVKTEGRLQFLYDGALRGTALWDADTRTIKYVKGHAGHSVPDSVVLRSENMLRKL